MFRRARMAQLYCRVFKCSSVSKPNSGLGINDRTQSCRQVLLAVLWSAANCIQHLQLRSEAAAGWPFLVLKLSQFSMIILLQEPMLVVIHTALFACLCLSLVGPRLCNLLQQLGFGRGGLCLGGGSLRWARRDVSCHWLCGFLA